VFGSRSTCHAVCTGRLSGWRRMSVAADEDTSLQALVVAAILQTYPDLG
jgi:hypothetical protein